MVVVNFTEFLASYKTYKMRKCGFEFFMPLDLQVYDFDRYRRWNHESSGIRQWICLHSNLSRKLKGVSWCSAFPPHASCAPCILQLCFWAHTVTLHNTYSQNLLSYPFPFKMSLWLILKIRRLEETSLEHPTDQWEQTMIFSHSLLSICFPLKLNTCQRLFCFIND